MASLYRENGFAPIPVKGKTPPPSGSTGRDGKVTDEKIGFWSESEEWRDRNVALRAEGWIAIDVDQYDDKIGEEELAEFEAILGVLPVTISSTSRGDDSHSRQYFFLLPEPARLMTKPSSSIEIVQEHHRYSIVYPSVHPDTGETYYWYDADGELMDDIPNVGDFEILPESWLEFLRLDDADPEHNGFPGAVDEWLATLTPGRPEERVWRFIDSIPTGEFGHDEMIKLTFRLVRLGAEREPGVDVALERLRREWLRNEYDTPKWQNQLDAALLGAIRKAGALEEAPDILPKIDALNRLPKRTSDGKPFLSLVNEVPKIDDPEVYAEARRRLIREVLTIGDEQLALSVARAARVSENIDTDRLLRELRFVRAEAVIPAAEGEPVGEVIPFRPRQPESRVALLSDAERKYLEREGDWWGTRYLEWVNSLLPMVNEPYHRMNRWTVASLVFSEQGHFRENGRRVNLGLFQVILGGSTSGKSESWMLAERIVDQYFPRDESPNIGTLARMSPNGFHDALLRRDGRAALVRTDEVQGFFSALKSGKQSYQAGILEDLADYYEGRVNAKQVTGDRELSGVVGHPYLTAHLSGVESKLLEQLEIANWDSGLLLRCVFSIGDPAEDDDNFFAVTDDDDDVVFDAIPKQWSAEFAHLQAVNEAMGDWRRVRSDQDALDRLTQLGRDFKARVEHHPHWGEILRGALKRFQRSIRKCATMIALSEASERVMLRHVLIAIEQGEEWMAAMLRVLDRTAETQFLRDVDAVEAAIGRKPRGEMLKADLFAQWRPREYAERLVGQLVAEGRVAPEDRDKDGRGFYRVLARDAA